MRLSYNRAVNANTLRSPQTKPQTNYTLTQCVCVVTLSSESNRDPVSLCSCPAHFSSPFLQRPPITDPLKGASLVLKADSSIPVHLPSSQIASDLSLYKTLDSIHQLLSVLTGKTSATLGALGLQRKNTEFEKLNDSKRSQRRCIYINKDLIVTDYNLCFGVMCDGNDILLIGDKSFCLKKPGEVTS